MALKRMTDVALVVTSLLLPLASLAAPAIPISLLPIHTDADGREWNAMPLRLNEPGDAIGYGVRYNFEIGDPEQQIFFWCRDNGLQVSGILDGRFCFPPTDVNDLGQVTGYCVGQAILWEPGQPLLRIGPELHDFMSSVAQAVNNRGEVVGGFRSSMGGTSSAFFWSKAAGFVTISDETGSGTNLVDINDWGTAVGVRYYGSTAPDNSVWMEVPIRWTRADGIRDLPRPDGFEHAFAKVINNRGQIMGHAYSYSPIYQSRAVFWDVDGSVHVLPSLGSGHNICFDLNEFGQVAGDSGTGTDPGISPTHPFLWSLSGGMTDLGMLDDTAGDCSSADMNNYGEIVGSCRYGSFGAYTYRAFYWNGTEMIDLGGLSNSPETIATAINDSGKIVGWSYSMESFRGRAVTWQVPGHPQGPAPGSQGNGFVELRALLDDLCAGGRIPENPCKSLGVLLGNAEDNFEKSNCNAVKGNLNAFVSRVKGARIDPPPAEALISKALLLADTPCE